MQKNGSSVTWCFKLIEPNLGHYTLKLWNHAVIYLLIVVKVFILVNCVNAMIVNATKNDFINH